MELLDYAKTLVAAGFKVWLTPTNYRDGGFLTYQDPENGCWGTFQESEFEGWDHHMPIKPSRENGSSMWHLPEDEDRWTVDAAKQCAQPTNYNSLVGTQSNYPARIFPSSVAVHKD